MWSDENVRNTENEKKDEDTLILISEEEVGAVKSKKSEHQHARKTSEKRCIFCGLPTYTQDLCENCQYSIFQIKELKNYLMYALKSGKTPEEWALKASEKICEILADYPLFAAYKNVVSEVVWLCILDEDVNFNGIEIEEVTSLMSTYASRERIIRDLYEMEIIDITTDRRIFPGKVLQPLLDLKKIYGDNFASVNWKLYTSAVQAVFILGVSEKMLQKYTEEEGRLPRVVLLVFKILSKVIQKYKELSTKELTEIETFSLLDLELMALMHVLGTKVAKNRFYVNITGIKDGNAKMIEDIDEKSKEFIIHKDFSDYIKIMIERIREEERNRTRT